MHGQQRFPRLFGAGCEPVDCYRNTRPDSLRSCACSSKVTRGLLITTLLDELDNLIREF